MATGTLGTTLTTSLTSINGWTPSTSTADIAAIAEAIKDDLNVAHPIWPGGFSQAGLLYYPNRGFLRVLPGDYVAVDANGWPVLVSKNSIGGSGWSHS
jgi:hypothetical protein